MGTETQLSVPVQIGVNFSKLFTGTYRVIFFNSLKSHRAVLNS